MKEIIHPAMVLLTVLTLASVGGCGRSSDTQSLMAKAQEYRQKGNVAASIIELKNVLQKTPDHAEARYWLGVDYLDEGDSKSAEAELRRALTLGVGPEKALPPLGRSLLAQGKFKEALDETDPARISSAQGSPELLSVRARAQLAMGNVAEAKKSFDQALALQPEYVDALLGKARLAASEKKLDEAARLIERALAGAPKSIEAWLMKGDVAGVRNDEAGATAAYQKVLELKPDNVLAHSNIASLHIAAGRFDDARKHIEQARKLAPANPMTNYLLALLEFRKQNFPAAREAVLQVLKVAPNHLPSVLLAGAIEFALGSHAQAQAYLELVLNRVPNHLYARKLLIGSLAKSGQVPRALEILQPGLKQAPEDGALMILAGELYMQSNEFAKATRFFEQAAKLDPKSAGTRTKLGVSRLALGETDRALADLDSAVQLNSDQYQADVMLIMSHLQRRDYEQALKAAAGLEKKQPNNPLTFNLKAAIYLAKKDVAAARKQLERALELQPTYIAAAMNLAQLDLQDKNPQAGRRRFEAILEKDKDNVQALLALAEFGPRIGATQKEQIEWLERARKASPAAVQPQLMLARLYAGAGDTKKALEVAQQAQASNRDNVEVLDTLGAIQLAAGEKNQALTTYNRLAALQPKSPVALYRLAGAQAANANRAEAASTLKKVLALKPDFIEAQAALVELEILAGHLPEAMKIAQQMQKQTAKSALGFVLEGDVLMAQKKFPQAAKVYETAYGMGNNGTLAIKLHAAYTQAGKPQEAEAKLAQRLKDSPDDVGVRIYSAEASLKSGQYQNAIEQYEWLLRKQPDNVLALNNLAWAYQQVKDPRALQTAEHAYKLKPDNAAIADTLGWMLVEQGNTKRGIEVLQKAVDAAPNAFDIRYHLAQALAKSGDKTKARNELERLLSTDAKFPQQAEALALLKQLRN